MAAHTFRASWPILDDGLTLAELRAEAAPQLAHLATQAGAQLLADPTWLVRDGRLYAHAPARPDNPED